MPEVADLMPPTFERRTWRGMRIDRVCACNRVDLSSGSPLEMRPQHL
jgi:hypothetical protein